MGNATRIAAGGACHLVRERNIRNGADPSGIATLVLTQGGHVGTTPSRWLCVFPPVWFLQQEGRAAWPHHTMRPDSIASLS
jgi:hypothetical protein